ncbi:signal transduction histidine kinase [Treponema pedis]
MEKLMKNNFFIFIHYFLIISCAIQAVFQNGYLSYIQLISCLIIMILSNIRMFFIHKTEVFFFILCLCDFAVCSAMFFIEKKPSFLLLTIPMIDSLYYNRFPQNLISGTIGLIIFSVTSVYKPLYTSVTDFIILFLISAQAYNFKLYNTGFIKQEKIIEDLIQKNNELSESVLNFEMYRESVEDLIMLKERNRISREIHDSIGHGLSTIIIQLNALQAIAKTNPKMLQTQLTYLNEFAKKNLDEIRFALREIKPTDYNKYETIILIHSLVNEFKKLTSINVQFTFSKNIRVITEEQNHAVYKAVQEFLSNSGKYANAEQITIHFSYTENYLVITMKDNGQGCLKITKGIGLKAIDERIKEAGGSVFYKSLPEVRGFFMQINIPI